MTDRSEVVLRVTPDYKLADEWALVLITQGLSPRLRHIDSDVVLSVPPEEAEMALAGLAAYEKENPFPVPKEQNRSDDLPNFVAGLVVAGGLILSHAVTVRWKEAVPWFERGSAEASRILDGELWRTVTALTLHADLVHLFSNAVAAAIFVTALSSMVGAGLAFTVLVISGACGNLANALIQGSSHIAVGASTAIFGAVGVLGSLGLIRRWREPTRSRGAWIPIAASFGLLAMLGTGTGRTDVLAHLFGFACGAALGVPIGLFFPAPPGQVMQRVCGSATAAVLVYCWTLALGSETRIGRLQRLQFTASDFRSELCIAPLCWMVLSPQKIASFSDAAELGGKSRPARRQTVAGDHPSAERSNPCSNGTEQQAA